MKVDIIKHSKTWFAISGFFILGGLCFVIQSAAMFGSPVKPGLDFTGGTKLEYQFSGEFLAQKNKKMGSESIQSLLNNMGLEGSSALVSQDKDPIVILKTRAISDDPLLDKLNENLEAEFGEFQVLSIDTVSPIVGPELFQSGLIALLITVVGIIIYISTRFRKDYAACAIIALFHDVFIVIGLFAFLGIYNNIEVNSLFITAILSVFGFSIHDTIVVFDRIRENQKLQTKNFGFDQVASLSIRQTIVRSLNTSLTVLMVLASLFFFGGESTKLFVGALFIGMFAGTYSSIFVASPLLVVFRSKKILQ